MFSKIFDYFKICLFSLVLLIGLQTNAQSVNDSIQAVKYYRKADTLLLYNLHDSSIQFFEKAEKLFLKGGYWQGYISCINKISENESAKFELAESLRLANEALQLCKEHLNENHLEIANAYINIGNVYYLTGKHEQALEQFNQALAITEKTPTSEKHLYSAPTNLGIGNVYYGKLQYEEAFRYFNNALKTNSEILGDDHPYVANSYLSIGNLYRNKGSYNLAEENYRKALKINKAVFGENHPDVASAYIGLADLFKTSGENERALQYYNAALVIYSKFLDKRNPKFGSIYLGFADIAKNKADYDQAIRYYTMAMELYTSTVGSSHQNTIQSLLGIANTYIYQEKFIEALDYYGKVLEINFNLVGEDHENTSAAYNNLGALYYFAGDFVLAERYFKKALKIDINIHGLKHPNVANAYYNLARVSNEQGQTKMALEYVQLAINASIIDFNEGNIFVNPTLLNFFDNRDLLTFLQFKGELLEIGFSASSNMKGLDISLNSFILSDSLVDQIRKSYTDRRDQVTLAAQAGKIYESAVNGSYQMLQLLTPANVKDISSTTDYETQMDHYRDIFFYFTEKNKASILFSSLADANAKSFGDIPDTLVTQELNLKNAINKYTQELSANPDSAQQVYYQRKLFEANEAYDKLVYHLEHDFPKYYDLKYDVGVVSVKDVQDFLPDSAMLVSYFVAEDYLYANYISKDTFAIYKQVKTDNYDKMIMAFRNSILYKIKKSYTDMGQRMYDQLFPGEIPKGVNSLIVVLDGVMATIPFEALLNGPAHDQQTYEEMPYLVKDYTVSYTFSANLLYKTFRNEKTIRPKASKDGFIIAPVKFTGPYQEIMKQAKSVSYEESGTAKSQQKGAGNLPSSDLPGTEAESIAINKLFADASKKANLTMYGQATETNLKKAHLEDYQYLHIASHGFVNQEEPEFSGVLFSKDTVAGEGILFSGEVYNLKLNAELVTLSACETALGKITKGEGIIGLSRALMYAGAKNVNVSLWPVSDASTEQLMTSFYQYMADEPVPQELTLSVNYSRFLREAKMRLIKEGEFAHPYFWSPFVLLGK